MSALDRWERTDLRRAPPASRWITSWSAQNVIVIPARAGPNQNCLLATNMFPDVGTTRSNSTAPGVTSGGRGSRVGSGGSAWGWVPAGVGMAISAGGSRSGSASRSSSGDGGEPLGR